MGKNWWGGSWWKPLSWMRCGTHGHAQNGNKHWLSQSHQLWCLQFITTIMTIWWDENFVMTRLTSLPVKWHYYAMCHFVILELAFAYLHNHGVLCDITSNSIISYGLWKCISFAILHILEVEECHFSKIMPFLRNWGWIMISWLIRKCETVNWVTCPHHQVSIPGQNYMTSESTEDHPFGAVPQLPWKSIVGV